MKALTIDGTPVEITGPTLGCWCCVDLKYPDGSTYRSAENELYQDNPAVAAALKRAAELEREAVFLRGSMSAFQVGTNFGQDDDRMEVMRKRLDPAVNKV